MDIVRDVAATDLHAKIESNNFVPTAAGLASSASAYAALAAACNEALQLGLSSKDLSRLARRGSGSASRSIYGGFAEWEKVRMMRLLMLMLLMLMIGKRSFYDFCSNQ